MRLRFVDTSIARNAMSRYHNDSFSDFASVFECNQIELVHIALCLSKTDFCFLFLISNKLIQYSKENDSHQSLVMMVSLDFLVKIGT